MKHDVVESFSFHACIMIFKCVERCNNKPPVVKIVCVIACFMA